MGTDKNRSRLHKNTESSNRCKYFTFPNPATAISFNPFSPQLFLACLKNLQSVNILKEIDTEKLFSNITDILASNVCFWRNSLFPLVRDMRNYKQPPCIENMCEGFSKMRETFQAYFRYCAEQSRCQHYCREIFAHNELFTAYLAWCETQKECNR